MCQFCNLRLLHKLSPKFRRCKSHLIIIAEGSVVDSVTPFMLLAQSSLPCFFCPEQCASLGLFTGTRTRGYLRRRSIKSMKTLKDPDLPERVEGCEPLCDLSAFFSIMKLWNPELSGSQWEWLWFPTPLVRMVTLLN